MKNILIVAQILLLGAAAYLAKNLYATVHDRKEKMEDYAEINMVNYELFNMQLWKEKALDIIKKEIKSYNFTEETYVALDDQIKGYLRAMHKIYFEQGELSGVILTEVKRNGNLNPFILKMVESQVPDLIKGLDLTPQIPVLSKQIVAEIKSNEPLIKQYLQAELLRLVIDDETAIYRDRREALYAKYDKQNLISTDQYLNEEVVRLDNVIDHEILILCLIMLVVIIGAVILGKAAGFNWMIGALTVGSIFLLILGVSMPMIDIDARLNSFAFNLLGQPIEFEEQVIYYQSKSIVEVTKTLWQGGSWDLKLVGVLVLMFSIVFPFFKLILSGLYIITDKIRNSGFAKGVIFHLGKWSMADVFVVAIFMAYIGFYGIISAQLNGISRNEGGFAVETINYSRLAPGAFFFTAYTILSICISILINREDKKNNGHNTSVV